MAGRVILLHGASSSGKTQLALAMQAALSEPFIRLSPDFLRPGLPPVTDEAGRRLAWWTQARTRFFAGFSGAVEAMAAVGNDLIVELVIEDRAQWLGVADRLGEIDLFVVGVHCDLAEIDRRERQRGNRPPGEGRADIEQLRIHSLGGYDLDVDTTDRQSADVAAEVIAAWKVRGSR